MATPLIDLSLMQHFSPVMLFILVFAMVYAFLQYKKVFGDVKILHAITAVVVAFFGALFNQNIANLITFIIPWFVFLMIFLVLMVMILMLFGLGEGDFKTLIGQAGVYWTILIIAIIIVLGGLSTVFGESHLTQFTQGGNVSQSQSAQGNVYGPGNPGTTDTSSGDFQTNLGATFYHPKVLGTLFLLFTMGIGVKMLSTPMTK